MALRRSPSPLTTVITSKGERFDVRGPFIATSRTDYFSSSGSRRNSRSIEEETQQILQQIRSNQRQPSPTSYSSRGLNMSRKSSIISSSALSSSNYNRSPLQSSARPRSEHFSRPQRLSSLPPLPPSLPKVVKHHYPLPPPSFPDAMVAVSKRLRNRSVSPSPQYAQLQVKDKTYYQSWIITQILYNGQ